METISEPKREVPVLTEADVVVVGGGPSGIGSALAAARNGAKTILVDEYGFLGGMQTMSLKPAFTEVRYDVYNGIISDIIKRITASPYLGYDRETNLATKEHGILFDAEYYKYLLDNMMEEAGVHLLYHTLAVGGIKEGNTVRGIFVESRQGRYAVLGKVVIDCTGGADIAWKSGIPCMGEEGIPRGSKKGRHMGYLGNCYLRDVDVNKVLALTKEQPNEWEERLGMYISGGENLVSKARKEGKLFGNRNRITFIVTLPGTGKVQLVSGHYPIPLGHHPWEIESMTNGEIYLRKMLWSFYNLVKDNIPGFENSHIEQTVVHPLLRDMHRIIGDYVLTEDDANQGKAFDDAISICSRPPLVQGPDDESGTIDGVPVPPTPPFDIPYRCLLPKETDNLLAAGSSISTELVPWAGLRYIAPGMQTGQAAGIAAALAVKKKVSTRELDVKLLQNTLREQGIAFSVKYLKK